VEYLYGEEEEYQESFENPSEVVKVGQTDSNSFLSKKSAKEDSKKSKAANNESNNHEDIDEDYENEDYEPNLVESVVMVAAPKSESDPLECEAE
jgi:hypothetical protein